MPLSPQILLPLENRPDDRFENYVAGQNHNVVLALQELAEAPEGCVFISGPQGSGKSHLLNASCNLARSRGLRAFYFVPARLPESAADGLSGLEEMDLVCIDDIDRIAGAAIWENALFHFFNRFRERHGRLVASSSIALSTLHFQLPDLASRLAWGLRLQIEPLADDDKLNLMRIKAGALGINLPDEVAHYLINRGQRDTVSLLAWLEAIRVEALAEKRKITLALARKVVSGG